jgi:hypothetical protein
MAEKKTQTEELLERLSKTEELLEKISKNLDINKGIETNKESAGYTKDSKMSEPTVNETKPSETKSKKMVRRSVAVALGIICILLIAGLGGAMAYYIMTINDKDNQINPANNTINQLNATIADQRNTIASLNANITNLTNEENQLQAWLAGNETLLNQTQTWLSGNITGHETQISSLNAQITQLQTWLFGNITAYQNEVNQYNNEVTLYNTYVADHHYTDENYENVYSLYQGLSNIANLTVSTVWVSNQTISQSAGAYTSWTESVNYAGYVSITVLSSTTSSTYANVVYSAYGVSYDNPISVGTNGTAYFPVLPSLSITVEVGNGNVVSGATETVTIIYHY